MILESNTDKGTGAGCKGRIQVGAWKPRDQASDPGTISGPGLGQPHGPGATPPPALHIALDKSLSLPEPQFSHPSNGGDSPRTPLRVGGKVDMEAPGGPQDPAMAN